MDITRDMEQISRRDALKIVGGVAATGALALAGCQQEAAKPSDAKAPSAPAAPTPEPKKEEPAQAAAEGGAECTDGIDEASKTMRNTLKYVAKSPEEGKMCSNCAQWKPPEGDTKCGGCNLFAGQVNPNGYCISYAPQAT